MPRLEASVGGQAAAGAEGRALAPERFHWLTSPRSTVIQTSDVHVGCCQDPQVALEELLDVFVRPPRSG